MGCGTSRATPVASTFDEQGKDEKDPGEFSYEQPQQRSGGSPPAAAAPRGPNSRATSPSAATGSAASSSSAAATGSAAQRTAGDDSVALALRSKRKGFVVDGTSVQVGANYQRKVVPKDAAIKDFIWGALKDNVLFAGYGPESLKEMVEAMEPKAVEAGDIIIQQGEPGDNFYAIESGKLEIVVNDRKVADWGEGTKNRTVGELALLYDAPRAATVRAATAARLWSIDRATFRALVANTAHAQHQKMKESLRKGLLEELSDEQLDRVASAANVVAFKPGEQIIRKGEEGEVFYIIDSGSVICKNLPGEQANNVLHAGDYFGERALLKREPRAADVYAEGEGATLIALHREDFENLLGQVRAVLESNMGTRLLLCVPLLARLGDDERRTLFSRLRLITYRDGTPILAQDSAVTSFFIINEGTVTVTRREGDLKALRIASRLRLLPTPEEEGKEQAAEAASALAAAGGTLSNGQWFGDGEIGEGVPSAATFTASGASGVQCFVLDAATYRSVLAPLAREMQAAQQQQQQLQSPASPGPNAGRSPAGGAGATPGDRSADGSAAGVASPAGAGALAAATSPTPARMRARLGVPMKEFEMGPTLGTGTFGRVKLVLHKRTSKVYALKMLQKAQIVALKQQTNIQAERDILFRVDHPFIIRLFDTYKDRDRLYMLMECVQGGELFSRLQNSPTPGRVTPGEARFYAACVLDAFEHLHAGSIVYRDLKPENLLIDSEGYLKIVDFGFAKVVRDRTYTLCGTPEYLAPELVLGRGHDKGVDYWALGILLYEQVAGYSPFADPDNNDQMVICRKILKGDVEFPAHFRDAALKDLILKLLVKDIPRRLGCMRGGAGDIKAHKFFRDHIDWQSLFAKRIPAPWRPTLASAVDTSNFDEYEEDDSVEHYRDDGTNWDKDF